MRQIFSRLLPLQANVPCARNCALIVLLSTLPAVAPSKPLLGQNLDLKECYAAVFSEPIRWTTSGAWVDDEDAGQTLLLIDTYRDADHALLQISPDGHVEPNLELKSFAPPSPPKMPLQLVRRDREYWLLDLDGPAHISRLDSALKSWQPSISLEDRSLGNAEGIDWHLMMVHRFSPMADGVLAFGDLKGPTGWTSAFLYFDDSGRSQLYRTLATTETARKYYLQNIAYLAGIGDAGYILFLDGRRDGQPVIAEVWPETAELRELSVPMDFRRWPHPEYEKALLSLRKMSKSSLLGPRQATAFYKVFEQAPVTVAGLYAWRDHLYLLGRRRAETEGEASWWLVKLDARNGDELSRTRLPTTAAHLTTVPGNFWAFIEKQPVQSLGDFEAPFMRINSMKLVPSAWFEESSPDELGAGVGVGTKNCINLSH